MSEAREVIENLRAVEDGAPLKREIALQYADAIERLMECSDAKEEDEGCFRAIQAENRNTALAKHNLALEAALRNVRNEAKMLSILDEWCGANLTEKEQANAAMRQAKSMMEYIDALLHDSQEEKKG